MMEREEFLKRIKVIDNLDSHIELFLYNAYVESMKILKKRIANDKKIIDEEKVVNLIINEFIYSTEDKTFFSESILRESKFINQFISLIVDKIYFNLYNSYHSKSLVSEISPQISTIELHLNFILNRLNLINNKKTSIVNDMFTKVFYMFKTINTLLINGAETEAYATWRTIHELECVIIILFKYPEIEPVYMKHIVYNKAFRDDFKDKKLQQTLIDELKEQMKKYEYKSKDMKKFIEYGWMHSIKDLDKYPNFKLNVRNGLEKVADLSSYSYDYEMSSEVAHSSPLLIYSNKEFYKSITLIREYESFFRLEDVFFEYLRKSGIEYESYEKMRTFYIRFSNRVVNKEISLLNKIINKANID